MAAGSLENPEQFEVVDETTFRLRFLRHDKPTMNDLAVPVPCAASSFDLGGAAIGEPMAVLMQEALAQIGIRAQINKIPGATWRAALLKKDMPLLLNRFGGWLNYPEYFSSCHRGQNAVFNTMSYQNPKLDMVITNARFAESKPLYDSFVKEMIQIDCDEVPGIPPFQPTMEVAMQKGVMGWQDGFHLQPDYRQLYKA
jgi:peptide/nickel transport system substrate-binding protein